MLERRIVAYGRHTISKDIVLSKQGFLMMRSRSRGNKGNGISTSEVFEVENLLTA